MAKTRTHEDGFSEVEFAGDKKLAYTEGFVTEGFLNRKNIHEFLKAAKELHRVGDKVESDGITAELVSLRISHGHRDRFYYKVDIGEESFFIKKLFSQDTLAHGGGYREAVDSHEAQELLKPFNGVKVVDFKLGYSDDYFAYYVSRWNPYLVVTLQEYLLKLDKRMKEEGDISKQLLEKKHNLLSRVNLIFEALSSRGYTDLKNYNVSYDSNTDTIYMFDLNKKPPKEKDDSIIKV